MNKQFQNRQEGRLGLTISKQVFAVVGMRVLAPVLSFALAAFAFAGAGTEIRTPTAWAFVFALALGASGLWTEVRTAVAAWTERALETGGKKRSHNRNRFLIRSSFDSFCTICVHDKNTQAMIAEILHAHDEQIQIHPRKKWWRLWVHSCTVAALIWHTLVKNCTGWPLRLFEKVIQKLRLP